MTRRVFIIIFQYFEILQLMSSKRVLSDSNREENGKKRTKITQFFQKINVKKEEEVKQVGLSKFKQDFIKKLSDEEKELLELEINTMEDLWFEKLHKEFTKPYFLKLKKFLKTQYDNKVLVFPPKEDIYSWSRYTPFNQVKVIILGQDPYHNNNQAHGLAFSVKKPTPPPPSLKNMYKALKIDYPDFQIPKTNGDLTEWAKQGVLMLNAVLTVKAHEAFSHSKKGWEQFTESVLKSVLLNDEKKVLLLWGTPAQKRFDSLKIKSDNLYILRTVHPSPLSARRGFFEANHFKKTNDWLEKEKMKPINWNLQV